MKKLMIAGFVLFAFVCPPHARALDSSCGPDLKNLASKSLKNMPSEGDLDNPDLQGNLIDRLFGPDPADLLKREELEKEFYKNVDSIQDFSPDELAPFDGMVKVVRDPVEGLMSKVMAIRHAVHTIDISYYIFSRDPVGYLILNEVRGALLRGTNIRIMVDSLGSPHPFHGELKALLDMQGGYVKDRFGNPTGERAKVQVVIFNPVINLAAPIKKFYARARMWWVKFKNAVSDCPKCDEEYDAWATAADSIDRRSHDKFLGVDLEYPELAIFQSGGRNIRSAYYGVPQENGDTFHDVEVVIRPIPDKNGRHLGQTLTEYYNRLYFHLGNKYLYSYFSAHVLGLYNRQYRKMAEASRVILTPGTKAWNKLREMEKADYLKDGFSRISVKFLNEMENISRKHAFVDPDGRKNKINGNSITTHIRDLIAEAEHSVDIVSPYAFFTKDEVAQLIEWARGGVEPTSPSDNIQALISWKKADPTRIIRIVSDSIYTADDMPAQAMIDFLVAPAFMKNPENPGNIIFYAFGKADGVDFGGRENYGKLHAKFISIDGGKKAIVMTYNGDPRSRDLNSEIGFELIGGQPARDVQAYGDELVGKSYVWGSPEWAKLRTMGHNPVKVAIEKLTWIWIKAFHALPLL